MGKDWKKSILATLDYLTNVNKHRRVLLTLLRGAQTNLSVVDINGELGAGTMPMFDDDAKFRSITEQVQMNTQLLVSVTFNEGAAKGMEDHSLNLGSNMSWRHRPE